MIQKPLVEFIGEWLEGFSIVPTESLFMVKWLHPIEYGGFCTEVTEVLVVSRKKSDAALVFVEHYQTKVYPNNRDYEYKQGTRQNVSLDEINGKEVALLMVQSVFDPHYCFRFDSLDEFGVRGIECK